MKINIQELNKEFYKSGEIAKLIGVSTRTIQNYCLNGKIKENLINNRRQIKREAVIDFLKSQNLLDENIKYRKDIIYARVSTHKQNNKGDLERQIQYIKDYVIFQNPYNLEIITDIGSGLSDNRKGLIKLLDLILNNQVGRIFILYKDRLTRFGFNYIKNLCDFYKTEIIIVSKENDDKNLSEELAEDIISIIHSFSGKLYGMRRKIQESIDKELK